MARTIARACVGATLAFSNTSSDSACIDIDDKPRAKRTVKRARHGGTMTAIAVYRQR